MLNPLNLVKKIFKSHNQSELDRIKKIVKKINDLERDISKIENSEFPLRTQKLKAELKSGKNPYQEQSEKIKKTGLVTRRKNIDEFRKKMKEKKAKKLSQ